jgi:AAA+ superfamily predicted ATPase
MTDTALASLLAAYRAGPSAELAKIIVFTALAKDDLDVVATHAGALAAPLMGAEVEQLTRALIEGERPGVIREFFNVLGAEDARPVLANLIDLHLMDLARELYIQATSGGLDVKSADWDELFGIGQERAKLRVVERPDSAEVTNLARYRQATTDFDDVVGLLEIKKQISKKIILPFQKPSLYQRFRKKIGGGVLLYGPPGCGKTLLARATAGECNASFFNIEVSDVLDMYIGESEQKLHAIFEKCRAQIPSVLFFDELEALASKREYARNASTSNVVSQFLTELDGFHQDNSGVLVLASTNVPWSIDPAFLRPGRFDRMLFVPPPDKDARAAILKHHMRDRPATGDINYEALAKAATGYSGADLANLVEMAADEAIEQSIETGREVSIGQVHFKDALGASRATTREWLTTARNYARYANDGGRYDDVLAFLQQHGK